MASILWFQFPAFVEQGEQILLWEFYHNENRNMNASLSEKAWGFLHVNVLKINALLGLFLGCLKKGMTPVFSPQYYCNDFASFMASMSSTSLWTTRCTVLLWVNLVRGLVRQSYGVMRSRKEKKPRSRTRPTVDGREPCAGWWWELIQNVPEMSYTGKKNNSQKMDEKSITFDLAKG